MKYLMQQNSQQEKLAICILNLPNHCPRSTSENIWELSISSNDTDLRTKENIE